MSPEEIKEICYNLQEPLEKRMEYIPLLTDYELHELIECLCSSYNIHPTFITMMYLYSLIMFNGIDLHRRIRVAETCDLYQIVMFLLHKQPIEKRIGIIETFYNTYLKIHSYFVLYRLVENEIEFTSMKIQIMKNLYTINRENIFKIYYLDWFMNMMNNTELEYKHRSNCADFLLTQSSRLKDKQDALNFLGLNISLKDTNITEHRENVHLFAPKQKLLDTIMKDNKNTICETEEILDFIHKYNYNKDLFQTRILNDKTQIGSLSSQYTLEDIIRMVWNQLTEELQHLLIKDLESSDEKEEGWACTTGYYNRIINIFQTTCKDTIFEYSNEQLKLDFFHDLRKRIDNELHSVVDEKLDTILEEMPYSAEEKRINYLTFKVQKLPEIINKMKDKYTSYTFSDNNMLQLSEDQFDEYFTNAIRMYENAL